MSTAAARLVWPFDVHRFNLQSTALWARNYQKIGTETAAAVPIFSSMLIFAFVSIYKSLFGPIFCSFLSFFPAFHRDEHVVVLHIMRHFDDFLPNVPQQQYIAEATNNANMT